MSEDLKYPVGKATRKPKLTSEERAECAKVIAELPSKLRKANWFTISQTVT